MSIPNPITGHCLCGAVSYEVTGEPAMTVLCHCEDCRRSSGAAYSVNLVFGRDAVTLDETEAGTFETTGEDTQARRQRKFCRHCGSQIVTLLDEMPDMVIIKAGTVDDPSWIEPQMELYAASAHPWVHRTDGPERAIHARSPFTQAAGGQS